MEEQISNDLKKIITDLIQKMGFSAQVSVSNSKENDSIICNLSTDTDSHFLIGQHGTNLQAIQHIVRLVVRKKISEKINFILDVNSYKQQRNESIAEQAQSAAKEAITQHRAIIMKPMSTYERRIVHMELSKNPKVYTESVGEGDERKIIVKPKDSIE
ncbi:MAG TPA: R3H domain-containing nucleic acid-binding protein [Candidatus Moranbacteria bacterium]|nr:R3H domain-containing nucleic acid-binding protein [Candidatus Moranbacteria bacterium]HRZ33601.1 R3H domain-containing nucleic acid-binding protein [Candidatus Moranbacteria bacterium]